MTTPVALLLLLFLYFLFNQSDDILLDLHMEFELISKVNE